MFQRIASIALISLSLTGCGLWGGSDEVEPNKLVDFTAEKQVAVKWSVDVGGDLGDKFHQMVPAISGDNIYTAVPEGVVSSFSLDGGKKNWQVDLETKLLAGAGAGVDKVVVTTESGVVICLDAANGQELWRTQLASEVVSEPQLNEQLVVLQTVNSRVVALDAKTGKRRWAYESTQPRLTLRGTSTPIVALDVTLAAFDSGKFVAIDNDSGTALWEQSITIPEGRSELERMTDVDGRPLLFENVIYVPSYQGQIVAINPFNAQTLWSKKASSFHSLAAGFGNIYASESNDHVQAFDTRSAASVWKQDQLENRLISSPVVVSNSVAVGDYEGYVHFMSQIDGHFIARYDVGGAVTGDMKVKDDVLYVLTDAGKLLALTLN